MKTKNTIPYYPQKKNCSKRCTRKEFASLDVALSRMRRTDPYQFTILYNDYCRG